MVADEHGLHDPSHMRLLLSVAEQLKVPLTIMALPIIATQDDK